MKADNPSQSAAFIAKARETSAAEALMGKLAKTPDPKHKPKEKAGKR